MRLILFVLLFTFFKTGSAQVYKPLPEASTIKFGIKMLGSWVNGTFAGLTGMIRFEPANLTQSTIDVSVEAATVNTGVDMRDAHLKEVEFFHVARYPLIQFTSNRIVRANKKNTWYAYGNLKMKGVSRAIEFPFTAVPDGNGYWFNGQFKINRKDFDVGESSLTMGDLVVVTLNVKAAKD